MLIKLLTRFGYPQAQSTAKRRCSPLLLWTLTCGLLAGSPPLPAQPETEPVLLVFGDSISAAYGMRVEDGWVTLLQEKLQQEGYGWRVVNASVSGETTDGGRSRFKRVLELHKPRLVILELGANDGLRGLPLQRLQANLNALTDTAQAAGVAVILMGMPLPANYGPLYTRRFAEVFRTVAREQTVAFVPFLLEDGALEAELMQEDGLHPNARAQPRLLEKLWPAIENLIRQEP